MAGPQIVKHAWNARAAPWLLQATGAAHATIKREVKKGISELYKVGNLWVVFRYEIHENQKFVVIVAAAGSGLDRAVEIAKIVAAERGAIVRCHTRNPRVVNYARRKGGYMAGIDKDGYFVLYYKG